MLVHIPIHIHHNFMLSKLQLTASVMIRSIRAHYCYV